ncbi:HEPN/Toprim-associated domain-containing protein [Aeromonas caviae]
MGSFADIRINGHILIEWKNTYREWYFDKSERIRKMATSDEERDFIGYRTTVSTIRRRLQLAGYDHKSLERDFNETRDLWLRNLVFNLEYYNNESITIKDEFDLFMEAVIPKKIEVLRNTTLDTWIQKFPIALGKTDLSFDDYYNEINVNIPGDPLMSFMLSPLHGVLNSTHHGFAGSLFPCMQMESYALLLLGMSNDDDPCELEITDIVNSGWVDDFEDIEQVQEGKTYFYKIFENSIVELKGIKFDESTPVLQRMIFSSVITAMESYLSDTLKKNVLNRDAIKKKFVKNSDHLKNSGKIFLNDIFDELSKIDEKIIGEIDKISFHNVGTVINLYRNVLLCSFPKDKVAQLTKSVEIRHDIVHRNGKTTDGSIIHITKEDVENLMILVSDVVSHIDKQILDGLLDTGEQY